jgi:drug/metabolite transporter (DMT)-like permease
MRSERLAIVLLVLLGAIWGSAFVVIRAGILAGASPFPFAIARFLIAAGVMAVIAAATRQPWPERRRAVPSILLGGLFMMGGYSAFLYWGEQYTTGGLASILIATTPLLSALIAFPLLPKERFGRLGVVGIALGFIGVAVIFVPTVLRSGGGGPGGALAVFTAALVFSIGSVTLRRLDLGPQGMWAISFQFAATAAILSPLLLLPGTPATIPFTTTTVASLLYLAVASSVLGFLIYYWLHDHVGPSQANLVTYVNPLAGLTVGAILLSEPVVPTEIAGFLLVLLGLVLYHRDRRRAVPAEPSPPHGDRS